MKQNNPMVKIMDIGGSNVIAFRKRDDVSDLMDALTAVDPWIRRGAAAALGGISGVAARPALVDLLYHDPKPCVLAGAAEALMQLGGWTPDIERTLSEVMEFEDDAHLALYAAGYAARQIEAEVPSISIDRSRKSPREALLRELDEMDEALDQEVQDLMEQEARLVA